MNSISIIARNEFSLIAMNPLVIVFVVVMFFLALVNVAGVTSVPMDSNFFMNPPYVIFFGFLDGIYMFTAVLFTFFAVCLGIVSVTDERSRGSLRVLFTKPLYRRDVILGKFLGIGSFLFLIILLTYTLNVSLMIAVLGVPGSAIELLLRVGTHVVLLFLNAGFTLGLVMVLGIALGEVGALIASLAFICYEWLPSSPSLTFTGILGSFSVIDPVYLYNKAFYPTNTFGATGFVDLYDEALPYFTWLQQASPYIVLMIAYLVIIVLVGCMLFAKEEA